MSFENGKLRRDRRTGRRTTRHAIEILERRDLLSLTVVSPLSLSEDAPFAGQVATFGATDLSGTLSDFTATVTWGDGTTSTSTSTSPAPTQVVADGTGFAVIASKTYTQFGTFPVTVSVTSSNTMSPGPGFTTGSGTATVADATLTPSGISFNATAGQTFSGVIGSFLDANPTSAANDFAISINWGDSQTSAGMALLASGSSMGTGPQRYTVSGTHTYHASGPEMVTATVTRVVTGNMVQIPSTATVAPAVPVFSATGTSITATAGTQFQGQVATFSDTTPGNTAANYTATITWTAGGTAMPGMIVPLPNGQYGVDGTFTYSDSNDGANTATIKITRLTDSQVVTASTSVSVQPSLANIPISTSLAMIVGQLFNGTVATFSDGQIPSSGTNFTASINWGDGQTTPGTIVPVAGSTGQYNVVGTHTYTSILANPFTVQTTITRTSTNQSVVANTTAQINPAPVFFATGNPTPIIATAGTPFQGQVATFTDTTPGNTLANYTATITWLASGTALSGTIVSLGNGLYGVNGTFIYQDSNDGAQTATINITRVPDNKVATATTAVIVQPSLTTLPLSTSLAMILGQPFNGTVATFLDGQTTTAATNFTALINWGDGQTSAGMIVAVAGSTGQYNVVGTHTYTSIPTANPFTVQTTITRTSTKQSVMASTAASLAAPAFFLIPSTYSAVVSSGASSSAGASASLSAVTLATLVDTNTTGQASDFAVTVNWGPATTTGMLTPATSSSGVYSVQANSFVYPLPGTYFPQVTVVRIRTGQPMTVTATAQINAPTLPGASPTGTFTFTGGLDALSQSRVVRGTTVTNQQEPILSGTGTPNSTISLSIRLRGHSNPISLGETVPNAKGQWSLVVGPLGGTPFFLYGVETPPNGPPSATMLLNGGKRILVKNVSLHHHHKS